jgi:hypothetical protein
MSSGPVSSGITKADTTWSVVIDTTTNSTTYPAGIRAGDAVFSYLIQQAVIPGPNVAFFNQPYGTKLSGWQAIAYNPQIGRYVHQKNQITFIAGTNSLSGTSAGSGGSTVLLYRYTVFRRSPDYFEAPVLSYLGTEVTTQVFTSQAVPYTGSPSVILGMAASSNYAPSNTQTCTIGGVIPTLIAKNPAADTINFCRLWYRANITPTTLTTAGNQVGQYAATSWRPFVVH